LVKLLLFNEGLNFYGYIYENNQKNHIVGNDFINFLKNQNVKVHWDSTTKENYFSYKEVVIYYPTVRSILERLIAIQNIGCGVSVWEIGQGLKYFLDLF
jgi:chitinase domain-containing protein 1